MIQSRTLLELDAWPSALIAVDPSGIIAWVEPGPVEASSIQTLCSKHGWDITDLGSAIQIVEGLDGEWLMPGLIDTHSVSLLSHSAFIVLSLLSDHVQHAPQFPNLGT